MAQDGDEMWKPYIYENADYGEVARKKSWDGEYARLRKLGVKGIQYSEFLKPYKPQTDDDDSHPPWEWTWPDDPNDHPHIKIIPRPGGGGGNPGIGDCGELGCSDTMVDCRGGCSTISCDCFVPPMVGKVLWDPTCGGVYIVNPAATTTKMPIGEFRVTPTDPVRVCLVKNATICVPLIDEYSKFALIQVCDARNVCDLVKVHLLMCDDPSYCCGYTGMTIDGDNTVDPGDTWTGDITPACPGATCTVGGFVPSCTGGLSCSVSSDGAQVHVAVADGTCGSFWVRIGNAEECPGAYKTVRINNTGQGGAWMGCGEIEYYLCNCWDPACCAVHDWGYHKGQVCAGSGAGTCGSGCGTLTCTDPYGFSLSHQICGSWLAEEECAGEEKPWCGIEVFYWGNCTCA